MANFKDIGFVFYAGRRRGYSSSKSEMPSRDQQRLQKGKGKYKFLNQLVWRLFLIVLIYCFPFLAIIFSFSLLILFLLRERPLCSSFL